jgi:dipeptidyl aminopeptidase/acylaminoacyl peptidase
VLHRFWGETKNKEARVGRTPRPATTPGRSKKFREAYYGEMADNTLPDQVAGVKELAKRHTWIDEVEH